MQLLEISITGIGPITIMVIIAIMVGMVFGALIYRNNAKKAEAELAQAKSDLAKLQAAGEKLGDAIKGK